MIQNEQFKELFEKQTKLIKDLSNKSQETQKLLKEKNQKPKDRWDKTKIILSFLSPVIVAFLGTWIGFTLNKTYKERETKINEVQTVEKFIKYLKEEDKQSQQNAIATIAALGNTRLAINLARLNPGQGSILALRTIVVYSDSETNSLEAVEALLEIGRNNDYRDNVIAVLQAISATELTNKEKVIELIDKAFKELDKLTPISDTPTPTPPLEIEQNWAIVIGSDRTLEGANYEVTKAQNTKIWKQTLYKEQKIVIFNRKGWYRTVIVNFKTKKNSELQLTAIKQQIRESSYLVNLDSWCPNYKSSDKAETKSFKCD